LEATQKGVQEHHEEGEKEEDEEEEMMMMTISHSSLTIHEPRTGARLKNTLAGHCLYKYLLTY
jgi:hypothetical protein